MLNVRDEPLRKRKVLQISQENSLMIHWNMRIWEWEAQWKFLERPDLCLLLNRGYVVKNYHALDTSDLPQLQVRNNAGPVIQMSLLNCSGCSWAEFEINKFKPVVFHHVWYNQKALNTGTGNISRLFNPLGIYYFLLLVKKKPMDFEIKHVTTVLCFYQNRTFDQGLAVLVFLGFLVSN